jgi:hypothetical protein
MKIDTICPACGKPINVYIDSSYGVPAEAVVICYGCNTLTTFAVEWEPHIWLGKVKNTEKVEAER